MDAYHTRAFLVYISHFDNGHNLLADMARMNLTNIN